MPCQHIQEQCSSALDDGASGLDIDILAGCGKFGKFTTNIERDMVSRMNKFMKVPIRPLKVPIPKHIKSSSKAKVVDAHVILPHEIFGALCQRRELMVKAFGSPADWTAFWRCSSQEVWFKEHPLVDLLRSRPNRCVPAIVHGDDAQRSRRVGQTIRLLHWFSPTSRAIDTLQEKIPCTLLDNDDLMSQAQISLTNRWVVWSFNCASRNLHPEHDWEGECHDHRRNLSAG